MATTDKPKSKPTSAAGASKTPGKPVSTTSAASSKKSVKERQAAARKKQQQQQTILFGIVAVAVLAVVAIVIVVNTQPVEATIDDSIKTAYADIPTGVTADGYYFIGAENAPTTMEEFSSFSCPACLNYHNSVFKGLMDKFKDGSLKFVYIPLTKFGGYISDGQSRGAICAGEQGKFWEMHDIMFDWQQQYATGANDYRRLTSAAGTLGLDTGKFQACLSAGSTGDLIAKAERQAAERGANSTPSVFLNGEMIYPNYAGTTNPLGFPELRGLIEANANAQ
jgi:protein-disulfide isomerase